MLRYHLSLFSFLLIVLFIAGCSLPSITADSTPEAASISSSNSSSITSSTVSSIISVTSSSAGYSSASTSAASSKNSAISSSAGSAAASSSSSSALSSINSAISSSAGSAAASSSSSSALSSYISSISSSAGSATVSSSSSSALSSYISSISSSLFSSSASSISSSASSSSLPELIIQENASGYLSATPGVIPTLGIKAGCVGSYVQSNTGIGANINWSINAASAGNYQISFRYAFGGASANYRDGKIVVNGVVIATLTSIETGGFTYTSSGWDVWNDTKLITIPLKAGDNHIRLESIAPASYTVAGLANIDSVKFVGNGLTPGSSSVTTYHTISVNVNTLGAGTAGISPVKAYYQKGETVIVSATPAEGYIFADWKSASVSNPYTFNVSQDAKLIAEFVQSGIQNSTELSGYGSVSNDSGLNKLTIGGYGATPVTVTTLQELTTALAGTPPLDIIVSGLITTPVQNITVNGATIPTDKRSVSLNVQSNTTIRGDGTGHLKNIELKINSAENVIIRDLAISDVIAWDAYGGAGNDAIQITGSKYIWIHHCDFYSNFNAGGDTISNTTDNPDYYKDYYGKLINIINQSSYITVSWNKFSNHWKALQISSGDTQTGDTVSRVTLHHNYFLNIIFQTPLIRYGKAHIYDNYFYNDGSTGVSSSSGINSRIGAEVYVENNYFQNMKDCIGYYYDTTYPTGYWNVSNNTYDSCNGDQPTISTTTYKPPYAYTAEIPSSIISPLTTIGTGAGVRNPVP
jgi:pectate lyase